MSAKEIAIIVSVVLFAICSVIAIACKPQIRLCVGLFIARRAKSQAYRHVTASDSVAVGQHRLSLSDVEEILDEKRRSTFIDTPSNEQSATDLLLENKKEKWMI